jgi:hypothetical protein
MYWIFILWLKWGVLNRSKLVFLLKFSCIYFTLQIHFLWWRFNLTFLPSYIMNLNAFLELLASIEYQLFHYWYNLATLTLLFIYIWGGKSSFNGFIYLCIDGWNEVQQIDPNWFFLLKFSCIYFTLQIQFLWGRVVLIFSSLLCNEFKI